MLAKAVILILIIGACLAVPVEKAQLVPGPPGPQRPPSKAGTPDLAADESSWYHSSWHYDYPTYYYRSYPSYTYPTYYTQWRSYY